MKKIDYMQGGEIADTHGVGTDEDSSIRPLALFEAGVVHNPLPGQCERLEGSKRNKDSQLYIFFKSITVYRAKKCI